MKRHIDLALLILLAFFLTLSCSGSNGQKDPSHKLSSMGITFVAIPGGTFQMGDEVGDLWDGCRPVHSVTLSGFEMGAHEVTNAQYAAYLNAALKTGDIEIKDGDVYGTTGDRAGEQYLNMDYIYEVPYNDCWIMYDNGEFKVASGKENWPVIAVSWYGAKAFAGYYGFDLPTEAEWEYAARGGQQFMYGTDDGTIDKSKLNYDMNVGHPTSVCSYPANPFGLFDMSGSVWEWCNDWYGDYPDGNVTNPTGAQSGDVKCIRQGTWDNKAFKCRAAYRGRFKPMDADYGLGFRVVKRIRR